MSVQRWVAAGGLWMFFFWSTGCGLVVPMVDGGMTVCTNGEARATTQPCGFNGNGFAQDVCVAGQWELSAECDDPDECANDEVREGSEACGLNGAGALEERCTSGQWSATGECSDTDECVNGNSREGLMGEGEVCGFNGNGQYDQVCVDGQWSDQATCDDPDLCEEGTTRDEGVTGCGGLNGRATYQQFCLQGLWLDTETCVDPDECVDGVTQLGDEACGVGGGGQWMESCVLGQWVVSDVCLQCGDVVFEGDVNIESVGDLAQLGGVTHVTGDVTIGAAVTSLVGLDALSCVDGELRLNGPAVTSLEGLEGITQVGSLYLRLGAQVTDTTALNSLRSIHRDGEEVPAKLELHIVDLPTLPVFGNLIKVDDIHIDSTSLVAVPDFSGLQTVSGLILLRNNATLESLAGLSTIEEAGSISIRGNDLVDLAGLEGLTTLTGSLNVKDEPGLVTLQGLDNLQNVGSFVSLDDLTIEDLTGLGALQSVGGMFIGSAAFTVGPPFSLPALVSLSGLDSLNSLTGSLTVASCPLLTEVTNLDSGTPTSIEIYETGLTDLTGLGASATLTSLGVWNNPALSSLAGLTADSISSFAIIDNPSLADLSGLEAIESAYNVTVSFNEGLTSLSGTGLETVTGLLEVTYNPSLPALSGLETITALNNAYIAYNVSLASMAGLDGVTTIGFLEMHYNHALVDFSGLENLTEVGTLKVQSHDNIVSLSGLNQLQTASSVQLNNLPSLSDISALGGIDYIEFQLDLINLPALSDASSLQNVTYARGVYVDRTALTSMAGFSALTEVGAGSFSITRNGSMTNLDGLENLQQAFLLRIWDNEALTDIRALGGLEDSWSGVDIYDNVALPQCEVDWLQTSLEGYGWTGMINAYGNDEAGVCL